MLWNDCLMFIHYYRETVDTEHVPHLFSYFMSERFLWKSETSTAFAGVVTGLCDRHPDLYTNIWLKQYPHLIMRAYAVIQSRRVRQTPLWAEYLINRWLVLATDRAAWELLCLCHTAHNEEQKKAAQAACDKVCWSLDGKPMTDSKGNLVGKTYFEDLRLQMTRLAKEYSRFTPYQRLQEFDSLPFSEESVREQAGQGPVVQQQVM